MKKSLMMLGAAAMVLASCTQNEVMEVAENRAIQFNSFVNNNTKADVTEVTSLTGFYVFGEFGDTEGTYGTQVFANESNSNTHYWVASKFYSFGAYANGENGQIANAQFNASSGTITFPEYTPNNQYDLVAAVNKLQSNADVTANSPVQLDFKHMLSQVKLTFKTTDADAYTLKISELNIAGAVSKATGTYNGTPNWSDIKASEGYTFDDIADVAVAENDYTASVERIVIPQSNENLTVTFKATISGSGMTEKSSTFTASLEYTPDAQDGKGTEKLWTAGYRYNYIATINADQIDPSLENQKIEFTPSVTPWIDANDTDKGELTKD